MPLLPPGEYSITARLAGFRTDVRSGIVLQVDQVARVDLTLSVGATTDRIVVTADAPLVSSETATVGDVIDSRKVVGPPLNGREFQPLVALVPGGALPVPDPTMSFEAASMYRAITILETVPILRAFQTPDSEL